MAAGDLLDRLARGEIVQLSREDWQQSAHRFEVVEEHDTMLRGTLRVARGPAGLVAIEEPSPAERVVRPLGSQDAARSFVADRLATYERMWDGCGCKVDYSK